MNSSLVVGSLLFALGAGFFVKMYINKVNANTRRFEQLVADKDRFPEIFGFDYPNSPEEVAATSAAINQDLYIFAEAAYKTYTKYTAARSDPDPRKAKDALNAFNEANLAFTEAQTLASRTKYKVKRSFSAYHYGL